MYVCASCLQQTRSQREIDSRKYGDDQLAQCARGWKQVERKQDICNGAWAPALHGALARASFVWLLRSRVLLCIACSRSKLLLSSLFVLE